MPEAGEVEVLYALRKDRWGQGLATEAARASVRFGFEYANLTRLIALAVPENIASRRVMEHLGFEYEKDAHYFGLDLVYYVLPREHFHADDSFSLVHERQFRAPPRFPASPLLSLPRSSILMSTVVGEVFHA